MRLAAIRMITSTDQTCIDMVGDMTISKSILTLRLLIMVLRAWVGCCAAPSSSLTQSGTGCALTHSERLFLLPPLRCAVQRTTKCTVKSDRMMMSHLMGADGK
jgi:hypothetical protein